MKNNRDKSTIAIYLPKGGIGKTTTSVQLAAGLAKNGKKVLGVDADKQRANMTLALGFDSSEKRKTIGDVIFRYLDTNNIDVEDVVLKKSFNDKYSIDLIPSNEKLITVEEKLMLLATSTANIFQEETSAYHVLKNIIDSIKEDYDYTIIDCPPGISIFTINILAAADRIILPMEPHFDCYESLNQAMDIIHRIKSKYNPNLSVDGILFTKNKNKTNLCSTIIDYVHQNFGNEIKIFSESIPSTIKIAELASFGLSIFEHDPKSNAAMAYDALVKEVMNYV